MKYRVFTRNWWRENPEWPNGLEPDASGRKRTVGYADSSEEAVKMCKKHNDSHKPGRLSNKAEFETV